MAVFAIAFVVFLFMGGIVLLSWLADRFPPIDIDAELRAMKAAKEAELEEYKRRLRS